MIDYAMAPTLFYDLELTLETGSGVGRMGNRAAFTQAVKDALATRAGHHCSFPGCDAPTSGPSAESSLATASTGMACHIFAASSGPPARRVGTSMSVEELASIENGIWMCYKHGKLIDADECTYPADLLISWREFAEKRAAARQQHGDGVDLAQIKGLPVADAAIDLDTPDLAGSLNDMLASSFVSDVWGQGPVLAARDIAIEIGRNALIHGGATWFRVELNQTGMRLTDNGAGFSHADLARSTTPRGGARALAQLASPTTLLHGSYVRHGTENLTILAPSNGLDEALRDHPCVVGMSFGIEGAREAARFVEEHSECGTVYIKPLPGIIAHSDVFNLVGAIKERGLEQRDIVLVVDAHSEDVSRLIREQLPTIRIAELTG